MRFATFAFALAASACLTLLGQTSGEITGEVRDSTNALVVGAEITITSKSTSAQRQTTTNESGIYSFPALQPGIYDVNVAKSGFQASIRRDIQLQVQQTARVDFNLQLGATNQVVEVEASIPLLATENATVGSVVERKRIVELPLNGRNFLQLVSLSPNVNTGFGDSFGASSRLGGHRSQQNIAVAGQRSEYNHFTLDGVENTDPTYNTYVFLPSIDALEEFKVQTGIYPAEFGRAIGQVNVSTKSGSNNFHGSLFEFIRNEKLDAKNYAFDTNRPPKDPFKWNQYGFSLGGPVVIPKLLNGRNRLFFMANWEGYRDRKQLRGIYNVPTAPMRAGNFAGFPTIYDPTSRATVDGKVIATAFPGNIIPTNRFAPAAIKLLEFLPPSNVNTGSFTGNLQQGNRRVIDKDQFTVRFDLVESVRSTWYGRYSRGTEDQTQQNIPPAGTRIITEPRQQMITNSRVFSTTMVNEFRISHTGFANALTTPLANTRNVNGELGIPGILPDPSAWGIPNVTINPFSIFGDTNLGPYVNNNHIIQAVNSFSWNKGKHAFRFGAEVRRDRFNTVGNTNPRGTLMFGGQATENPQQPIGYSTGSGTAMADFLLGYIRRTDVAAGLGFGQFRATTQNYFFDDTWRITSRLTLSMGLRYENTPPYYDQSEKFVNVSVPVKLPAGVTNPADRSLHPTLVRIGSGDFYQDAQLRFNSAINVARDGRLGSRGIFRDNNDFAPRLGIAYSPSDRWTIRAGAGVFFVQDQSSFYFDGSRNLAGRRIANSDNNFPNLTFNTPFPDINSLVTVSTPQPLGIDPARRTPYTIQWSFNVQRQLGKSTVIESGYLGSQGHKLQSWLPFNDPQPSPTGTPLSRAPFPEFTLGHLMTGIGNSNYHSWGTSFQHRLDRGLTVMSAYTWSKSIDQSSGARQHDGERQFPQNSDCLRCERGLSNFHVGQRLVTSSLYELPIGKGRALLNRGGVVNAVLGGWQVSSIVTLQTGSPITVWSGYDASNRGYGEPPDRPNATGATVALPRGEQDPNRFFNTAAFLRVPTGTFGNTGRNTLIGPGLIAWDFSTIKNIRVREGQNLQFRFEAFNLPNHPNWGIPNSNLTDANFGKIRSTRTDMRDLQFGLKYLF